MEDLEGQTTTRHPGIRAGTSRWSNTFYGIWKRFSPPSIWSTEEVQGASDEEQEDPLTEVQVSPTIPQYDMTISDTEIEPTQDPRKAQKKKKVSLPRHVEEAAGHANLLTLINPMGYTAVSLPFGKPVFGAAALMAILSFLGVVLSISKGLHESDSYTPNGVSFTFMTLKIVIGLLVFDLTILFGFHTKVRTFATFVILLFSFVLVHLVFQSLNVWEAIKALSLSTGGCHGAPGESRERSTQ